MSAAAFQPKSVLRRVAVVLGLVDGILPEASDDPFDSADRRPGADNSYQGQGP